MRKKDATEKDDEIKNKKNVYKEKVGVQRLIVIQPVDEQVPAGSVPFDDHISPVVPSPPAVSDLCLDVPLQIDPDLNESSASIESYMSIIPNDSLNSEVLTIQQ